MSQVLRAPEVAHLLVVLVESGVEWLLIELVAVLLLDDKLLISVLFDVSNVVVNLVELVGVDLSEVGQEVSVEMLLLVDDELLDVSPVHQHIQRHSEVKHGLGRV